MIPGFVDCHTHAVWAGNRRADFTARLDGGAYTPGGIAATVAATRQASDEELVGLTRRRLGAMAGFGTTTVEVKSGYGWPSAEAECRLLEVIAKVAAVELVRIESTYLGAHVVPDGRQRAAYVEEVVATLPDACVAARSGATSTATTVHSRSKRRGRSFALPRRLGLACGSTPNSSPAPARHCWRRNSGVQVRITSTT